MARRKKTVIDERAVMEAQVNAAIKERPPVASSAGASAPSLDGWFSRKLRRRMRVQERVRKLAHEFTLMTFDLAAGRTVPTGVKGVWVNVPLIWHARLPCRDLRQWHTRWFTSEGREVMAHCSAPIPMPTTEAAAAMAATKGRFDRYELFWVPRNITVKVRMRPLVVPQVFPDPVLVGVVDVPTGERDSEPMYFKLARWIDDGAEDPYWGREGY